MKTTEFQMNVYAATRLIPKGKVTTYKYIGDFIGTRAYRAVGNALRRNPFAPEVPCHRVIASDLTIGGFGGEKTGRKPEEKKALLKQEGVAFEKGRLKDTSCLLTFGRK